MRLKHGHRDMRRGAMGVMGVMTFVLCLMLAMPRSADAAPASLASKDPYHFVFATLLGLAIEPDMLPLRWIDPRVALRCGTMTRASVNGKPIVTGARVPDQAFELDLIAHGCYPMGANGPRLDGAVRFTVFREDWGFSAVVAPTSLRIASCNRDIVLTQTSGAIFKRRDATKSGAERLALHGEGWITCH